MSHKISTTPSALWIAMTASLIWLSASSLIQAQADGGRRGGPPLTAKASAPIDLTGYWTAVISEDWSVRMLTAPKGDFGSGEASAGIKTPGGDFRPPGNIPYKPKGVEAAMAWNPEKDEAEGNRCKAYGAVGIMRLPTRLHITWQDDNTLKMEADLGMQTRLFHFGPPPRGGQMSFTSGVYIPPEPPNLEPPAGLEPSLQGYSVASWTVVGGVGSFERGGSLKVVTTHLKPGYYWKNGMPYTGNAVLTEHFRVMQLPDSSVWIRFTQMVEDPEYLTQPFLINYLFKKLPNESEWNPTPCSVK